MAQDKSEDFSDGLATLGGVVGLLLGAGVASEDPELSVLGGALMGGFFGALAGKVAGVVLSVALQILIGLLFFAIAALRVANIVGFIVG